MHQALSLPIKFKVYMRDAADYREASELPSTYAITLLRIEVGTRQVLQDDSTRV